MLQSSRRTGKRSVGLFTFFSADAGRFLAAEGDRLVLRDTVIDRRCVWEVFMKEEIVIREEHSALSKEQKELKLLMKDEQRRWQVIGEQVRDIKEIGRAHV